MEKKEISHRKGRAIETRNRLYTIADMLFTQHGLDNVSVASELGFHIVQIAISSISSAFEMSAFAKSAGIPRIGNAIP